MNNDQDDLAKLTEKLDRLELKLESQIDQLKRMNYFKKFSVFSDLKQQGNLEDVEANLQTRRNTIISVRRQSHIPVRIEEKSLLVSLKTHFLQWMLVSTWTGPAIIIRVKSIVRKIYWAILFLLCLAATIYVLVMTVNTYMEYGEVTTISVTYDATTVFPTVSQFCL